VSGGRAEELRRLVAYGRWATELVRRACAGRTELLAIAEHVETAERTWLARCAGGAEAAAAERFLAALDDGGLARRVRFVSGDGRAGEHTVGEILEHVVVHGAHHRGQIAAALRRAGGPEVECDVLAWVEARAPARSPRAPGR
jgi:uncharacterized damage-inducible protein DinB